MNILQVSTADIGGGAEKIAWDLFKAYRAEGHQSWLAVGTKKTDDANVLHLDNDSYRNGWARLWLNIRNKQKNDYLMDRAHWVGEPMRKWEIRQGREDFEYPAAWQLLNLLPQRPDVIHCHNLHTGYFDLRALSMLSRHLPVILTVHDQWLLTGHCAYTLECRRWEKGCGDCPDLEIYPAISRDATGYNWRRKKEIFERSQLHISAPCHWLLEDVKRSILGRSVIENRVIPYGLDFKYFHPGDRGVARSRLGIPDDVNVLLFSANGVRRNPFKDYETLRAAVGQASERLAPRSLLFIALGADSSTEQVGHAQIRFVPYEADTEVVASYIRAADLYVHAAKADTFPNAVLEALACGTPVVATAVGGIPEQVKGWRDAEELSKYNRFDAYAATGILVPSGDSSAMAVGIERLLTDDCLRRRLGENAAQDARQRFDLKRQTAEYLDWYAKLVQEAPLG
jgi:glycosyltransferase involved in cell wall biosynthesis